MDLNSYIQLKEACSLVSTSQYLSEGADESVDSIWEEVEAFAHALVEEEGLDLSDMTWDEVYEAYLDEALKGPDGKPLPVTAADKAGVARTKNDAAYASKAKEFKRKNPGVTDMTAFKAGGGKEKANQQGVDRGSGGSSAFRRSVQNSNIQRQGRDNIANKDRNVANQAKAKADKAAKNKADSKSFMDLMTSKIPKNKKTDSSSNTGGGNGGGGNGGGGNGGGRNGGGNSAPVAKAAPAAPAAPAKDRMAGASKADRMGAWAKANPKLAAAKTQRDATRGTSATTNPLMKDLKSRMPKPAAPNKPSGGGLSAVKPQSFKSSVSAGSAMRSAASKPTPKPAASLTGNKASSFMNKSASNSLSKPMKEESDFDIILTHLIEQGFGDDEALSLMVNMSEEKREEILQLDEISQKTKMKAYAAASDVDADYSYGDKVHAQADRIKKNIVKKHGEKAGEHADAHANSRNFGRGTPSAKERIEKNRDYRTTKAGKMHGQDQKKLKSDLKKNKTQKEETDSLYQAYLSMMSEEGSDKRKDKHLESGGHSAKTDYSKPPATGNDFGKKKPMSDEDRSAAMAKIVAKLKKQGGK